MPSEQELGCLVKVMSRIQVVDNAVPQPVIAAFKLNSILADWIFNVRASLLRVELTKQENVGLILPWVPIAPRDCFPDP